MIRRPTQVLFLTACLCTPAVAHAADANSIIVTTNSQRYDDLEWMMGRWRVITREYLDRPASMFPGGDALDFLEYVDAYLPYADDKVSVTIAEDPLQRPICARFLVRMIRDSYSSNVLESLRIMGHWYTASTAFVGTKSIAYGIQNDHKVFGYERVRASGVYPPRLILFSKHTRVTLMQIEPFLDIENCPKTVALPVVNYTYAKRKQIRNAFLKLKQEHQQSSHQP